MTTDKKATDLTAITTPADEDILYIVDADDTTDDPAGSSRQITYLNLHRKAYGEIYAKGNTTAITLNSAGKTQVTTFTANGESYRTTPDHTNDHITIDVAGKYLCTVSTSIENQAAQAHKIVIGVFINNGVTQMTNVHSSRNLGGGAGDTGSASLSGIIDLSATDTVELWCNTDSASDRDVTLEDVTLSVVRIGE
jgi:hypothetical protein